jgi:hypothetical protein
MLFYIYFLCVSDRYLSQSLDEDSGERERERERAYADT